MNIKALFEKFTKDWPAKVICLCLAIFIYSFHQIITLDSKTLMIPMQIISDGNTCHSLRSMRQKHIISGVTADYRGLISVQLWLD